MDPISIALALAPYAPKLIGYLTGSDNAENVAKVVVDVAQQVTGATSGEGALELIKSDPKLAADFADKAAEREVDLIKAHLADVADARDHDVKIQESANASYLAKNVAYWIDLFIVVATFTMAYVILFKEIPTQNREIFYTTFGSLITLCMTVVQFHRGSTHRSQQKDETIKTLVKR